MTFQKGQSGNPKGRERGSHNQFTSLKDAFIKAFNGLGGAEGLLAWAETSKKNEGMFYSMITKMLPTNIDLDLTGNINVDKPILLKVVETHIEDQNKGKNGNPDSANKT